MRSVQQERAVQAVVDAVGRETHGPHILLDAVAGAGKTHTLLEMVREVRRLRPEARILLLMFNGTDGHRYI